MRSKREEKTDAALRITPKICHATTKTVAVRFTYSTIRATNRGPLSCKRNERTFPELRTIFDRIFPRSERSDPASEPTAPGEWRQENS